MTQKIIISGGPGSGKTSLINALSDFYPVQEEMARRVIKEQLSLDTDALPWKNVKSFSEILIDRLSQETLQTPERLFCDRSMVDVKAYLLLANCDFNYDYLDHKIHSMNYHKDVFYMPFWPEIYEQDLERKEDLSTAALVSKEIKECYLSLGFSIIEIPKVSIEKRMEFILGQI